MGFFNDSGWPPKLWQCELFEMIEKPLDERGTVFSDELL